MLGIANTPCAENEFGTNELIAYDLTNPSAGPIFSPHKQPTRKLTVSKYCILMILRYVFLTALENHCCSQCAVTTLGDHRTGLLCAGSYQNGVGTKRFVVFMPFPSDIHTSSTPSWLPWEWMIELPFCRSSHMMFNLDEVLLLAGGYSCASWEEQYVWSFDNSTFKRVNPNHMGNKSNGQSTVIPAKHIWEKCKKHL